MRSEPLSSERLFSIGPVPIHEPVVTTWLVIAILVIASVLSARRFTVRPGKWQSLLEIVVTGIEAQIAEIIPRDARRYVPLIGTLFLFLVFANLAAAFPGLNPPTGHLETPAALAVTVFMAVHWYGFRGRGFKGHLRAYFEPSFVMLPLNIISEITRTFALMIRLFGNVMSGHFVVGIILALAGLLLPIPFIALEILTGLIQAYIFSVLATVFIGAAAADGGGQTKGTQ